MAMSLDHRFGCGFSHIGGMRRAIRKTPNLMTEHTNHIDALDLSLRMLDWYGAMGVDAAIGEEAVNWLQRGDIKPGHDYIVPRRAADIAPLRSPLRSPSPSPQIAQPTAAPVRAMPSAPMTAADRVQPSDKTLQPTRTFVATPPDAAVTAARAAARTAPSLDALGEALARFDGCALKATAKNLCFYGGAAQAKLMIVGEAPTRDDDLAGTPFTGAIGELLAKMLAAIGMSTDQCHLTNAVYWRPPGNRHPTPQELDVCQPFLERQITLVAPDVVLLLGESAARQAMDTTGGIMRVRGKWRDSVIGGHPVRAMATLSPAYLMKSPLAKQHAWRDLLAVKAALAGHNQP